MFTEALPPLGAVVGAGTAGEQDASRPPLPSGGGCSPLVGLGLSQSLLYRQRKSVRQQTRTLCRNEWLTQYRVRKVETVLTMLTNNQLQLIFLFILAVHQVPCSTHTEASQHAHGAGGTSSENLQTR